MGRWISCLALAALLATARPGLAQVLEAPLLDAVRQAPPGSSVAVIVRHAADVQPESLRGLDRATRRTALVQRLHDVAERSLAPLERALAARGAAGIRRLWIINGVAARVPAAAVAAIARLPGVESVRLDETVAEPALPLDAGGTAEWNLAAVGAPALWSLGISGQDVVVSAMDSGVDASHADLKDRWRGGANSWFDPNGQHATPYDASGHGTRVLGLLVGGDAGGTAVGMAPGARWIAAKIFDDAGSASFSGIHAAFQWQLDPDGDPLTDDAPHVVNNSWGLLGTLNQCYEEFRQDVQMLRAADIAVVFAAGNDGPSGWTSASPANYPESLAVGASDEAGAVALFSSRGPGGCNGTQYPHLVAPGVGVRAPDLTLGGVLPRSYAYVSGTSYAAPHVSGAVALLRQAFPDAATAAIEEALRLSAADIAPDGADPDSGFGLLDLPAAYALLMEGGPPVPVDDADGDGWTVAGGDCDDGDGAINPGAAEIVRDGIDQDCNGHDMTIIVTRLAYQAKKDALTVEANSLLGAAAKLSVAANGWDKAMSWNKKKGIWQLTVQRAGGLPGGLAVHGVEGRLAVAPGS